MWTVAVGLGLSIPFIIVAFNLDVVAEGFGAAKRFVKPFMGRSVILFGVGLVFCGVIFIIAWTSHLATNVKATVTVVVVLVLLLGLLATGVQGLLSSARADFGKR